MRLVAVVVAALVVACAVPQRVVVTGRELHHNLAQLRTAGEAEVTAIRYTHDHDPKPRRMRVRFDQTVLLAGKPIAIAELAKGCKDVVPFASDTVSQAGCPLVKHRDAQLELGRSESRSIRLAFHTALGVTLAGGILGGGTFGLICEAACKDGSRVEQAGDYALYTAGAMLLAVIAWWIADCADKWGQAGCRD